MIYFLIINRSQTRTETHTVLGFNVGIQGVVVDELEIISTVALPHSSLLQLEPDNVLVIILTATTHHPLVLSRRDQNGIIFQKSPTRLWLEDVRVKWVVISSL